MKNENKRFGNLNAILEKMNLAKMFERLALDSKHKRKRSKIIGECELILIKIN